MSLEFKVVDAFTDKPFSGNPAAVIILPEDHTYPYETLLGIAAEFNLSETAYITVPKKRDVTSDGYPIFGLRWFTPTQEFKLCGHATLASSSVIFADEKLVPKNVHQIQFSTLAGILTARRILSESDGAPRLEIELPASDIDQASEDIVEEAREVVSRATSADVSVQYVGVCGSTMYEWYMLIEIDEKVPLKGMKVNSGVLGELHPVVILCQATAAQDNNVDKLGFDYRTFAAPLGLTEDPVCGSATSFAARHWTRRSQSVQGKNQIRSVSARGGNLEVVWEQGNKVVRIRGHARVASRGEVYI